MRRSPRALAALLLATLVVALVLDLAEAKRKKRTSFGKSTEDYLPRIKLLLVAIFAPVILYAVVSLARDPALPTITKRLGRATLDRFATFLGPAPKYKRR